MLLLLSFLALGFPTSVIEAGNTCANPNSTSSNAQYYWTLTPAPFGNWESVASSNSSQYLAAVISNGGIYASNNYGEDWTLTSAPDTQGNTWFSIASSSSGQYLCAGQKGGGIYTSSNHGGSWTQSLAPDGIWISIASSSSGQYLCAVQNGGGIYTSSDFGGNWTKSSATYSDWYSVASSSSGQYLAAVVNQGGIYTSDYYGVNWVKTSAPDNFWLSIASSDSGQYLVAGLSSGGIYTSNNFGADWIKSSAPDNSWVSIASSSSGQYLVSVVDTGGIYTSNNYGEAWVLNSAPINSWASVTSSSTGDYLTAVIFGGGIYSGCWNGVPTSQPTSVPTYQPSSQPSSQPTNLPSSLPSSQPTNQPTTIPSSSPTTHPSTSPTGQPSANPSTRPSSQPSTQPSRKPTSQPSASPSGQPTNQPSSFPTLPGGTVLYKTAVSTVNSEGMLESSTVIEQLGNSQNQNVYFSAKFLQTGFGEGSFTVSVSVDNLELCTDCTVDDVCGYDYVECCNNQQINDIISNSDGGSITITSISSVPYSAALCDSIPYFNVTYALSLGNPFPTFKPTRGPESSSTTIQYSLNVENTVVITVVFVSIIAIFAIIAYYTRKEDEGRLHQLGMIYTVVNLVLFGGTFIAQLLFASVLFNNQYNPIFGYCWLSIRGFFILVSFTLAFWVLISGNYSSFMNWEFMSKNKKVFGVFFFFMLFQPILLQFLPWYGSKTTEHTLGFPTYFLYYLCSFLTVIESMTLTFIFALFAVTQQDLFSQSFEQQLLFFLSIFFTFFLGAATAVEALFVGKVQNFSRTVSKADQMELSNVENPIFGNK